MSTITTHDICSTLQIELDFETGLTSPDHEGSWTPGTVRHSDASYALVLNRFGGRWSVQLCSVGLRDDPDDEEHRIVFDADDQPDLAVLAELFQTLADREVVDAGLR